MPQKSIFIVFVHDTLLSHIPKFRFGLPELKFTQVGEIIQSIATRVKAAESSLKCPILFAEILEKP